MLTWVLTVFSLIAVTTPSSLLNTGELNVSGIASSSGFVTVKRVPAIVGGEADLPCDTRPPLKNDSLVLIVWYRDNMPVYSYDNRLPATSASWVDQPYIGRALWYNLLPSRLNIWNIQARDRAVYRCRVDFYTSPTRNYNVSLDVVELPNKPVVFDDKGTTISGTAGPYYEGGEFKLNCTVTGGYPSPRIQWLQDDTVLDTLNSGSTRSLVLVIRNATRAHLSAVYTCSTDNTLLVQPLKTSVKIDLYLKPLTVEITSREQPLSVDIPSKLWCKTTGSRPPATISWWIGEQMIEMFIPETSDANETESLLEWTPTKHHNGEDLTCRAEHPHVNSYNIEEKITLNVYYQPAVVIKLGDGISQDIIEGNDIYFTCLVDANPPAYKVVWEHNSNLLQHNPSDGVILGNKNLVIQKLSKYHTGRYSCAASNVEGDGKSNHIDIKVIYQPECKNKETKIIGGVIQEATAVACEVDAYPPPDVFEWTLNSSTGFIRLDPNNFSVDLNKGKSILTYTPVSEADYGTLSCRATNLAGMQHNPCIYTLLPATKPDPPSNCSVHNLTDNSLDLQCSPGYDGGLKCVYLVEVWSSERLVVNVSSEISLWNLRKLGANRQLELIIYTANLKGKSERVILNVETLKILVKTEPHLWGMNWTTGAFLAAVTITSVTLSLAVFTTRTRHKASGYEETLTALKKQKAILRKSPDQTDDKNPDIIPCNKGLIKTPSDPPSYATLTSLKNSQSTHSFRILQKTEPPTYTHLISNQNVTSRSLTNGTRISTRDIVTNRTALLSNQESRV